MPRDFARIESPSSINTYKQCPRKYYYQYILSLPTVASIHLVRGKAVHEALEQFFKLDIKQVNLTNWEEELRIILLDLFDKSWQSKQEELESFMLGEQMLEYYRRESVFMIENFWRGFVKKIKDLGKPVAIAFVELQPRTEVYYKSAKHGVQGFVDAIHRIADQVILMDYKTSKSAEISDSYRLQLAIYCLLYYERHGDLPGKVGINFLKFGEQLLDVDSELLALAKKEVEFIHSVNRSKDIKDYPKAESPLCKWGSGQCDFFDVCK
ncbi:MAG: PD-(D/E)XK nuclease family protein [Candidatus Woesearchaeota archaeon]